MYLPPGPQKVELKTAIREEAKKRDAGESSGADFFSPFWADARSLMVSGADLAAATKERVRANPGRRRLYPALEKGFGAWWAGKRWGNEPHEYLRRNVCSRKPIAGLGFTLKIENMATFRLGDGSFRLVYPYFSEEPRIADESARIGLYLLSLCLPQYPVEQFEILDVLRAAAFSAIRFPLTGAEASILERRYNSLKRDWARLEREYMSSRL